MDVLGTGRSSGAFGNASTDNASTDSASTKGITPDGITRHFGFPLLRLNVLTPIAADNDSAAATDHDVPWLVSG